MDATDLRIVRGMGLRPFEWWPRDPNRFKPGGLAMQAGVSPETVKTRILRMQVDGVLAGYEVYPNPRHFALEQSTFHLRVSDEVKARVRDDLEAIEGLVAIYDFLGSDMCVDFAYNGDDDLARKLRLVRRLTEQDDVVPFYDRAFPPPARELSRLDWRIIRALRGDGRRSPNAVAEDLGVSARTVRRRLDQMEKEGAFDVVAVLDLGKVSELSVFNLVFHMDDPADQAVKAAIHRTFDEVFMYAWQPPSKQFGSYHATVFARDNAEMEGLRRKGASIEGVARCDVMIPCGAYYTEAWVDGAIADRAA